MDDTVRVRLGRVPSLPPKNKILQDCVFLIDIFRFRTAMTSFKDARNLLLERYNDGIIDDDEFILLYKGNFSNNPEFPYEDYERFDLDAIDDTECKA